ncbi:hypothetical protein M011DRAFT_43524 [Sporormia fimetaria CBS 119925]|uniref:Uncharacterized protein n=1 Tax=Sporormia fimetaria CBS 119925 TaxID=1340428 RepID=A0A6A6VCN3_9PLEO|nr:hypothetical protein M011DRAFT_43524 [Sporormia fimetaria CBS 119925]
MSDIIIVFLLTCSPTGLFPSSSRLLETFARHHKGVAGSKLHAATLPFKPLYLVARLSLLQARGWTVNRGPVTAST